jgi:citrate synthase
MSSVDDKFHPGLEGVIACETAITHIDAERGILTYAGLNAISFAADHTWEETLFLLLYKRVPDSTESKEFFDHFHQAGKLSLEEIALVLNNRTGSLLQDFRTCISALGAKRRLQSWIGRSQDEVFMEGLALVAATPKIMEILHTGQVPLGKPGCPGYAEELLWGMVGRKPSAEAVRMLEKYMIYTIDHSLAASTFSARVTISTGPDIASGFTSAISTFLGLLHGGAPEKAPQMLDAIGSPENARDWVRNALKAKELIFGFGHRIYKRIDPRATALKQIASQIGGPLFRLAEAVEKETLEAFVEFKSKPLPTNVDYWTGLVLESLGIERDEFNGIFCASRMGGWLAHLMEQLANNRIFRPGANYVGIPPCVEDESFSDAA